MSDRLLPTHWLMSLGLTLVGCFQDPETPSGESSAGTGTGSETSTDASGTAPETGSESMTSDIPETDTETSTDTGSCVDLGCPCVADDGCSPGLACVGGECAEVVCGDSLTTGDELCDDGNTVDGDGCDNDCSYTEILAVDAGGAHTCVLIEGGRVRCWGLNGSGQLGIASSENIGDDELPSGAGDVDLPMPAVQISAGLGFHTCALLENGSVFCWGLNENGQLGYGNTNNIGDDEHPIGPVDIGSAVEQIAVGAYHTCARTNGDDLRCWGLGSLGRLGYGNGAQVGDDEFPSAVGDVDLGGGPVTHVALGGAHSCIVSLVGGVYCWGRNDLGQLGYGNTNIIGDNETPASVGAAPILPMGLGPFTKATIVASGVVHTCAVFETADAVCWGDGTFGQLGNGNTEPIGDNELPSTLVPLDFPDDVVSISGGAAHSCALLAHNDAYCWGGNAFGQLGYGNLDTLGDDEPAATGGPIDLGATIVQIDAGFFHTCARTAANEVRCWGNNDGGQLGLGHTNKVGDDEFPIDEPPVSIF